jgi:hypothetical protein
MEWKRCHEMSLKRSEGRLDLRYHFRLVRIEYRLLSLPLLKRFGAQTGFVFHRVEFEIGSVE